MQLLIATQNKGKVREYKDLLTNLDVKIVDLRDVGLANLDVDETGTTFVENAILKAKSYGQAAGCLALADDSGLVVDALDGRPGIYSARYGGAGLDDAGRRAYLLNEMRDIPEAQRKAHFVCVIAVYDPVSDQIVYNEGVCHGQILFEERDNGEGFGYDPLFLPDGYTQSFGELPAEVKNRISHRGVAVAQLPVLLRQFTG